MAINYEKVENSLHLLTRNTCNGINLYRFWRSVLQQEASSLAEYFHPDALIRWHCTNEQFTAEEFIKVNCDYPGQWDGHIERLEQSGDLFITVTCVYPTDRFSSFHVTSFFRIKDEKILSLDEYWADDGPPPSWRRKLCLGKPIQL